MRFSDRIGVTKPQDVLLLDCLSAPLRNSIWNFLLRNLFFGKSENYNDVIVKIAEYFFKYPVDALPSYGYQKLDWLRQWFFDDKTPWFQIYNFLEYIVISGQFLRYSMNPNEIIPALNHVLQEEMSGYRIICGVFAPISNKTEITAINEALNSASGCLMDGVNIHLKAAITLMSQKPSPDYRNSIKESISAVEALTKSISGEKSGGLDRALSTLDSKLNFHGAFKAGLLSLYGYTSDSDGIRHAILDEPSVGFDEAKFMLVSCSALINFMLAKSIAAGLILGP